MSSITITGVFEDIHGCILGNIVGSANMYLSRGETYEYKIISPHGREYIANYTFDASTIIMPVTYSYPGRNGTSTAEYQAQFRFPSQIGETITKYSGTPTAALLQGTGDSPFEPDILYEFDNIIWVIYDDEPSGCWGSHPNRKGNHPNNPHLISNQRIQVLTGSGIQVIDTFQHNYPGGIDADIAWFEERLDDDRLMYYREGRVIEYNDTYGKW